MVSTTLLVPEKLGGIDVTQYIGREGEIFYDPSVGFLRLADNTPGGILLNMIGRQAYLGVFYSTITQTNLLQINKVSFNTTHISDGIQIQDLTKITFLHPGRYNIQFSIQLEKTDSGTDTFELFFLKNGVQEPWSNTKMTLVGNSAKAVAAWNYVVEEPAGAYVELGWYSADVDVQLHATGPTTAPDRPGVPSAILTVTQV